MDIHKIKDLPVDELRTLLEGENCGMEQVSYSRPLTPQELSDYRNKFSQLSIKQNEIEDELKGIKENYKSQLKLLKQEASSCLDIIKQRAEPVFGNCFKLPDYESGIVHLVDQAGFVADSRAIKAEEKQLRIHHTKAV